MVILTITDTLTDLFHSLPLAEVNCSASHRPVIFTAVLPILLLRWSHQHNKS